MLYDLSAKTKITSKWTTKRGLYDGNLIVKNIKVMPAVFFSQASVGELENRNQMGEDLISQLPAYI